MENEIKYPENMDVVSGFGAGSGYELCCQKMVIAGYKWLRAEANKNPRYLENENIIGVAIADNSDAHGLDSILLAAADGDATGAMMQATMHHAIHASKVGWDEYIKQIQKHNAEQPNDKEN